MNPQGFLGTSYNVPTDPNYYLSQVGLSALAPQAWNSNTLSAMFSPQGMMNTPVNAQANNPFEEMFMKSSDDALKLPRKQIGPGGQQQQGQGGALGAMS